MKKRLKILFYITLAIAVSWFFLTFWTQYGGKSAHQQVGNINAQKWALIVYNPDPIYNLDQQVCLKIAEGLKENGYKSDVITVDQQFYAKNDIDLFVFCANTYNWNPDWGITKFIREYPELEQKNCIAITLGAGSTDHAQKVLEEQINARNMNILISNQYWLMRPNDETRLDEDNVKVATDMALQLGKSIK